MEIFPGLKDNISELQQLLIDANNKELSEEIVKIFTFLNDIFIYKFSQEQLQYIDKLTGFILFLLTDQRFIIPPHHQADFASFSTQIAHMAYLSNHNNTDEALKKAVQSNASLEKILALYSHFNSLRINLDELFAKNSELTSIWWSHNLSQARNSNSKLVADNLAYFASYQNIEKNFHVSITTVQKFPASILCYFSSSYLSNDYDRKIKQAINKQLKVLFVQKKLNRKADFKRVLVISGNFQKMHAVYKSISPLIEELKGSYYLGLLNLSRDLSHEMPDYFDEVMNLSSEDKAFNIDDIYKKVESGNYGIVIFPDIGINQASILLSILRLAPIQISCYGHPVSSFGGEIDYFIGGEEVEIKEFAYENYSEKLITIPGLAAKPVFPTYKLKNQPRSTEDLIINCNWGSQKFNYDHLLSVKKIVASTKRKIMLRFTSIAYDRLALVPFCSMLLDLFNEKNVNLDFTLELSYEKYMEMVEDCDFAIDSYPFGGYNRIVDALFCGKPIIALEGTNAANRLAGALLRSIGLNELVAKSEEELLKIASRLIEDNEYKNALSKKIKNTNLKELLCMEDKEKHFKAAIDNIVANYSEQ